MDSLIWFSRANFQRKYRPELSHKKNIKMKYLRSLELNGWDLGSFAKVVVTFNNVGGHFNNADNKVLI